VQGKIDELEDPLLEQGLKAMVEMIKNYEKQEDELEKSIEVKIGQDPRYERLKTAPGIGMMTAAMMIAVVDDINRFKSAKEFASYLGLTPKVSASAEMRMMGSITRSGSEILRRYLVHGARAWMRYDPKKDSHREWAEKVKERRGMNKATVALAHRMSRIAFAMLRDEKDYIGAQKRKSLKKVA
jgi:transposase